MTEVTEVEVLKLNRIAALNDSLRRSFLGGRVVYTPGVDALSPEDQNAVFKKVMTFDDFNEDNDPYGQHDFGAFDYNGTKYFFKIDYYDKNLTYHSEDPANPNKTIRVLTIMQASEY